MDLINSFNKASIGEYIGHAHPTDPVSGDILFQKTSNTNLKAFITNVSRNAVISDLILGDDFWYTKKTLNVDSSQILSATYTGNKLDDGAYTTFDINITCKLANNDFFKYQETILNQMIALQLNCIVR